MLGTQQHLKPSANERLQGLSYLDIFEVAWAFYRTQRQAVFGYISGLGEGVQIGV